MTAPAVARRTPRWRQRMFDTITLLGEVLWTGVLVSLASLPLVTMPAALAAGIRHMERHIDAREDGVRLFIGEVRRALVPGGVIVGLGLVALTGILALQSMVANVAGVPGAQGLGLAVLVLLWFLGTLVVEVCASWAPGVRWRVAMVDGAARLIGSPKEGALIALAVALTGIAVWQLPPLVIPALGCLAFAAAVVGVRRRRPEEEAPAEHR